MEHAVIEGRRPLAQARTDVSDQFIYADEPLASLQHRCGGAIPGVVAIPALLETVRKVRHHGLKLGCTVTIQDGDETISAWVETFPREDGNGCEIVVRSWQTSTLSGPDIPQQQHRSAAIVRELAELTARLDAQQCLLAVEADAPDLQLLAHTMREGLHRPWTEFVDVGGSDRHQPLHWRLLDGADVHAEGSYRRWRVHLLPQEIPGSEPVGFELCLTSDEPVSAELFDGAVEVPAVNSSSDWGVIGREIAPVLRQPLARIIANAETIRTRLAGPLADEYSSYAADIAAAGQHLLALLEDLTDLEVVEADGFTTAPDDIDLADIARRAGGILGMRAHERGIVIETPGPDHFVPAVGEFRRVLQILLNLLGNAIRYGPPQSEVRLVVSRDEKNSFVSVIDKGIGLDAAQQARLFEKFERLGRTGDGGSGLGLYISRRLARAMGGDLTVASDPGRGACFTLILPTGSRTSPDF